MDFVPFRLEDGAVPTFWLLLQTLEFGYNAAQCHDAPRICHITTRSSWINDARSKLRGMCLKGIRISAAFARNAWWIRTTESARLMNVAKLKN